MNHQDWQTRSGQLDGQVFSGLDSWHLESNVPFELDLRTGMAAYSRGADANGVFRQAEESLRSARPGATGDRHSCELAGCSPGAKSKL